MVAPLTGMMSNDKGRIRESHGTGIEAAGACVRACVRFNIVRCAWVVTGAAQAYAVILMVW